MSSAEQHFVEMGVLVRAARALRALDTPIAHHKAAEMDAEVDDLLGDALEVGADIEFALDDLPEDEPGDDEHQLLDDLEGDLEEALQGIKELEHLECPECVDDELVGDDLERLHDEPLPLGTPGTATPHEPMEVSGARGTGKVKKGRRRRYVACSPPELRRGKKGKRAWCSLCAYKRAGGQLGWAYLPVGKNPLIKPRFALLGGRRIKFAAQEEIDALLQTERAPH